MYIFIPDWNRLRGMWLRVLIYDAYNFLFFGKSNVKDGFDRMGMGPEWGRVNFGKQIVMEPNGTGMGAC